MQNVASLIVLVGLAFATGASAQALDCDTAMTQMDMNACAMVDFDLADADLNAAYGQARAAMRSLDAVLSADERGAELALRDAQRAWITFRDAACTAEGFQMRGGSAEPLLVFGCKARLTEQRAQDLWNLAAGIDG